jgi:hypothetical protein
MQGLCQQNSYNNLHQDHHEKQVRPEERKIIPPFTANLKLDDASVKNL